MTTHTNKKHEPEDIKDIKKKLIHNTIKFVIGISLLITCRFYVESHPAEKISFFSWFKVIWQNVDIALANIIWDNWAILKQKYHLESYYEALIALSEEKPCVEASIKLELHDTYDSLVNEPKNTFANKLDDYIQKQIDFERELRVECAPTDTVQ